MEKIPDPQELEKELSDYLSKKYGSRIKVMAPQWIAEPEKDGEAVPQKAKLNTKINFDLKPEELEAYLDEYVIKQDVAKSILATKVCTHFNRIRHALELGRDPEAGVGKTYLVKLIAKKIGVPFIKGDATKFSETGYVGGDVEDLVRDLVYAAGDDLELAQYGIIYIDEIDKIASSAHTWGGPDVSRTGVQRALLKPMEETEVDLKVAHDPVSQIQAIEHYRRTGKKEKRTLNTRHILFIVSGAFGGLDKIVKERLSKQEIGFRGGLTSRGQDRVFLKHVTAEDLIKFGFESEFIGRLPVTAVLEELTADDLYEILRNPNNPIITSKKRDFRAYGIDIQFEDQALRILAEEAAREKTGARGLVSVIERVLIQFEKRLPSTDIAEFVVTPEVVTHPQEQLELLLSEPDNPDLLSRYREACLRERDVLKEAIWRREHELVDRYCLPLTAGRVELMADRYSYYDCDLKAAFEEMGKFHAQVHRFEEKFFEEHDLQVHFDDSAIDEILRQAFARGISALAVCREMAQDLECALKLARDRTSQDHFLLTQEAICDLDSYLNRVVQDHYQTTLFREQT